MTRSTLPQDDLTHLELPGGVHALSWGSDGPPVVLVHGLDGSAANWVEVGRLLGATNRVLALDLPGFGRTRLGRHRSSMVAHADLVAAATRRWLADTGQHAGAADGRAMLAGNSMGGVVAMLARRRHPDLFGRLTLVASALPRAGTSRLDASILPAAASLWLPGVARAVAGARHATPPTERVAALLDMCVAPGASLPSVAVAEMEAVAAQRDRRDHIRAWGRSARSLWGWLVLRGTFHAAIDEIGGGVLLTGSCDPIIPAPSATAFLARHPDWTHVDLAGVGHVPPLEAAAATADVICSA